MTISGSEMVRRIEVYLDQYKNEVISRVDAIGGILDVFTEVSKEEHK